MTLPRLETARLLLRPLHAGDAAAVFGYCANPNVSRYTLWEPHRTVEDSLAFIRDYAFPNYAKGMPEPFGIVLEEAGDEVIAPAAPESPFGTALRPLRGLIGTVGAFWVSEQNRCLELAYALAEPYWGKGIVAEAAAAFRDFVFETYAIERLQCRCKVENAASARVMEKVGLRWEGTLRSAIYHRERFWDMHYYALLRDEWSNGALSRKE